VRGRRAALGGGRADEPPRLPRRPPRSGPHRGIKGTLAFYY
jgi:hypothetical protein